MSLLLVVLVIEHNIWLWIVEKQFKLRVDLLPGEIEELLSCGLGTVSDLILYETDKFVQ